MKRIFRFRLYIVCLLALVTIVSCKVKRPDDILPESTMEKLLYDYHIAKAMGEDLPYNENYKKALYAGAVFKKYGTTEAVFDSSMVWYTRNTEVLSKIYEKVNKRLKTQQDAINHLIAIRDKKPVTSAPGDSIDVWAWQHIQHLTGMPMDNKYTFILPADTNFKKRDELVWEINYQFLNEKPDMKPSALMAMQIVYENDSIISQTKEIAFSGIQRIRLQSDTLGTIKEIKGFIYYPKANNSNTSLMANHIKLTRYHANDSLRALADSLKVDSSKVNSVKKAVPIEKLDTVINELQQPQRLSPEEMNRRRSNPRRNIKPEQIEVEKHIQQERQEQKQERQINQRRRTHQTQRQ